MRTLAAIALAALATAQPAADKVTTLPGFGAPLSNTYSGYVSAGAGKHHHYVYMESLNAPSTDPLVIWFNGGPGCSSLEGAFSESGLYHIEEFVSPPTLKVNPWSWTNVTNSLYMESPAGVGFSYCDSAAGCRHSDTSTAQDNLAALLSWFAAFPALAGRPFWISGESYAGVYIPTLADAIITHNKANPGSPINLQGILVGNGCIGRGAGTCGNDALNDYHDIVTWRGHGLVTEPLYDAILGNCTWTNESPTCSNLLNEAANAIGDIDVYYLYNICSDPAARLRAPRGAESMIGRVMAAQAARAAAAGLDLDPNCFGTGPFLEDYFNAPGAAAAYHVSPDITFALCSNNNSFGYNSNVADERTTIYPNILASGAQVLIYNGEADLCVPWTDNEWWTRTFAQAQGLSIVDDWAPWTVPGEQGDYVGGYRINYSGNFTFLTVRGAGHMVPETRPEPALTMLKTFISGTPF